MAPEIACTWSYSSGDNKRSTSLIPIYKSPFHKPPPSMLPMTPGRRFYPIGYGIILHLLPWAMEVDEGKHGVLVLDVYSQDFPAGNIRLGGNRDNGAIQV